MPPRPRLEMLSELFVRAIPVALSAFGDLDEIPRFDRIPFAALVGVIVGKRGLISRIHQARVVVLPGRRDPEVLPRVRRVSFVRHRDQVPVVSAGAAQANEVLLRPRWNRCWLHQVHGDPTRAHRDGWRVEVVLFFVVVSAVFLHVCTLPENGDLLDT